MPKEQQITVTCGSIKREYLVVYRDDPPERAEAVHFFQEHAASLFPSMEIPLEVEEMPIKDANAYLRRHPIQEKWTLLTVSGENPIHDDDLARLQHLSEIRHVKIFSNKITDAGVKHLLCLRNLTHLVLYSNRVTDDCLKVIRTMHSLTSLDMQMASKVSREAVLATVDAMPWLVDAWPPPDPVRLAECQRRSQLSRPAPSNQVDQPQPITALRYVDLSRKPLPRPLAELFEKDDIERLDMIHCGLEVLPEAIGRLTQLRTLYANWGRLTDLPSSIGLLTNLEALWLNDNRLTGLPSSFRGLSRLKKLSLDDNQLVHFPPAILDLIQLEELRMSGNRVSTLPNEIGNLTELRILSL